MTNNHLVAIEAKPESVSFDPAKTAVIVVDMQNHFGTPGGTFYNVGVDVQPIRSIVPSIARVLEGARAAGLKIVFLRMPVSDQPGHAISDLGPLLGTPEIRWEAYLDSSVGQLRASHVSPPSDRPTWNADIIDGIQPDVDDIVVTKRSFGGFYETILDDRLRAFDIANLVFTGCTTSICVETTLREACVRGYRCLALADCVAEPIGMKFERTNSQATLHVIQTALGWVTESAAFLRAFAPQPITLSADA